MKKIARYQKYFRYLHQTNTGLDTWAKMHDAIFFYTVKYASIHIDILDISTATCFE